MNKPDPYVSTTKIEQFFFEEDNDGEDNPYLFRCLKQIDWRENLFQNKI